MPTTSSTRTAAPITSPAWNVVNWHEVNKRFAVAKG